MLHESHFIITNCAAVLLFFWLSSINSIVILTKLSLFPRDWKRVVRYFSLPILPHAVFTMLLVIYKPTVTPADSHTVFCPAYLSLFAFAGQSTLTTSFSSKVRCQKTLDEEVHILRRHHVRRILGLHIASVCNVARNC